MGWTHGQNERRKVAKMSWDKETPNLQKTRMTTAKIGDGRIAWREIYERQRTKKSGRKRPARDSGGRNQISSCTAIWEVTSLTPTTWKQEEEQNDKQQYGSDRILSHILPCRCPGHIHNSCSPWCSYERCWTDARQRLGRSFPLTSPPRNCSHWERTRALFAVGSGAASITTVTKNIQYISPIPTAHIFSRVTPFSLPQLPQHGAVISDFRFGGWES